MKHVSWLCSQQAVSPSFGFVYRTEAALPAPQYMVAHNGEMKSHLTFNAFSQRASILRDPETKEQMCTRKLCGSIFQTIPFSANLPGEDNG